MTTKEEQSWEKIKRLFLKRIELIRKGIGKVNIIVFGATGSLGMSVVKQALDSGHQVKAFVRNLKSFTHSHIRLEIVKGNVLNQEDVITAVSGQDIIISALGTGKSRKKTTVFSQGAQHIIRAAEKSGIKRLICVTSAGVEDDPSFNLFYKILRKTVFKNIYGDMCELPTTYASLRGWGFKRLVCVS